MTYAIGEIVYGVDLNDSRFDNFKDLIEDILVEIETPGFGSAYSGNGDKPYWFGIHMGNIDECNTIYVKSDFMDPTPEQLKQFDDELANL